VTPESFETLYKTTERALFNCLFRWVWNREEAIDLVQEAFIKLWERRSRIDEKGAKAYLFRTAMNLASKRNQWQKRWHMVALNQVKLFSIDFETLFFKKEEESLLRTLIKQLPEKNRQVLILVRFSDLSYSEIAGLLNIPSGTVASRYHTALKKLREDLEVNS